MKKIIKLFSLVLIVVMTLVLVGCDKTTKNENVDTCESNLTTSIRNHGNMRLITEKEPDGYVKITATTNPSGLEKNLTWTINWVDSLLEDSLIDAVDFEVSEDNSYCKIRLADAGFNHQIIIKCSLDSTTFATCTVDCLTRIDTFRFNGFTLNINNVSTYIPGDSHSIDFGNNFNYDALISGEMSLTNIDLDLIFAGTLPRGKMYVRFLVSDVIYNYIEDRTHDNFDLQVDDNYSGLYYYDIETGEVDINLLDILNELFIVPDDDSIINYLDEFSFTDNWFDMYFIYKTPDGDELSENSLSIFGFDFPSSVSLNKSNIIL